MGFIEKYIKHSLQPAGASKGKNLRDSKQEIILDKLLWICKSWDLYETWEEKLWKEYLWKPLHVCWISEQVWENERKQIFFPVCLHNICLT